MILFIRKLFSIENQLLKINRTLHGTVANMLDCNIIVSKSELLSFYHVPFWINTLGKDINSLNPPVMG